MGTTWGEATLASHRARISHCRSCQDPIIWLPMPGSGKMNPVNADTVEPDDEEFKWGKHISHFATCKQANEWRRKR